MNESTNQRPLSRGGVVELHSAFPINQLQGIINKCWDRVFEVSESLRNKESPVKIIVEIWPDTGRLIWLLRDRREFCRIELSASAIEKEYFAMLNSPTFAGDYDDLINSIRNLIRESYCGREISFISRVSVRDSDDSQAEEVLDQRTGWAS